MQFHKNVAISDSGFLFNPTTGDSYTVNPIGMEVIKLLQKNNADKEIIKSLLAKYMIDEATVEKDLYDFKVMLQNYKLME